MSDTLTLPVNARGAASPSWWATMIMLVVDATIFASFAFAFIHTAMRLDVCPPPGTRIADKLWPLLAAGLLITSSLLIMAARRGIGRRWLPWTVLAALACMLASFACDPNGHRLAGLAPTASAWGATIAAMLSYQGLHVIGMSLCGLYLCARAWTGRVTADSRATLDNVCLMWHYTSIQGVIVAFSVQALPKLMG